MPKIAKIPVMPTASLTCFNDANVIANDFFRYFVAVIKSLLLLVTEYYAYTNRNIMLHGGYSVSCQSFVYLMSRILRKFQEKYILI